MPVFAGFVISLLCAKDIKGWYKTLKKPRYTPPSWLFGPVWTVLYVMMGVSAWQVWTQGGWGKNRFPLSIYTVQFVLNLLWNPTFFLIKKLDWALIDIIALLGVLATTIVSFNYVDPLAALLLVPYFAWTLYATYLNFFFCELNPKVSNHVVDAFTIRRTVEKRVQELKAEMNDGAKNE